MELPLDIINFDLNSNSNKMKKMKASGFDKLELYNHVLTQFIDPLTTSSNRFLWLDQDFLLNLKGHSLTHSSLTHSSLTHSLLTHSLTQSLTHSITHSLTHSLTQVWQCWPRIPHSWNPTKTCLITVSIEPFDWPLPVVVHGWFNSLYPRLYVVVLVLVASH